MQGLDETVELNGPEAIGTGSDTVGRARVAAMLAVLTAAFALSHVYRTLPTVLGAGLARDFGLSAGDIGVFAGAFHLSFALLQLPLGVALDRFGPRRTVASLLALACAGAVLSALAPGFGALVAGQLLIGAGCSGALMGALVFTTRWYPPARFAAVAGLVVALGGVGMLISATPMAWAAEHFGWRGAFALLAGLSVAAMVACAQIVRDAPPGRRHAGETSVGAALRGILEVMRQKPTLGILLFNLVAYPAAISLRGVWLGPYLAGRHGMDNLAVGNAAIGLSLAMIVGPILFGRLDPGDRGRRAGMAAGALASVALLVWLGLAGGFSFAADYAAMLLFSVVISSYTLQFADARRVYPDHLTGRALATINMATFLGVALMQWLTGAAADRAAAFGFDPLAAVLVLLGGALAAGLAAFVLLPSGRAA
jgi:predicted MFS family arabinose efflux permease